MANTTWFVLINAFTPGHGYGTVISNHLKYPRAVEAALACQPRERGSYLPTTIGTSDRRLTGIVRYTELGSIEEQ